MAHLVFAFLAVLLVGRSARAGELGSLSSAALETLGDQHVSLIGAICEQGSSRLVERRLDLAALGRGEETELAGGRSGLRGLSLPAALPVHEEDQGCIDRVRGEEVERTPAPLAFDASHFDPVSAFHDVLPILAPFESARVGIHTEGFLLHEGIRSSLERPPRA